MRKVTALLLLLISVGWAFNIEPTSISDTIKMGSQKEYTVTINSTESFNQTFTMSKSGSLSSWLFFSATSLDIPSGGSKTFKILVSIPSDATEGEYNGTVYVSNGTTTKVISLSIEAIKWVFDNTYWFSEGDTITISPFSTSFEIESVGRDVVTSVGNFSVGDTKTISNGDIELTLLDRYGDQARFRIRTTEVSTSVTVEHQQETEQTSENVCEIEPLINRYMLSIQKGASTKKILTIKNVGTEEIQLKDIVLEDVIQTSQGTKPISVSGSLGNLKPGEELTLTVTIDARDMDIGTYTPSIVVVGYCGSTRAESRVDFDLTVIEKLHPETLQFTINPASLTANLGEVFTITISNVPSDSTLSVIEPAGISRVSLQRSGNSYVYKAKGTSSGNYTITFLGTKDGIVSTLTAEVSIKSRPKNMAIVVTPNNPRAGDHISVVAQDSSTHQIIPAQITVIKKDLVGIVKGTFTYSGAIVAEPNTMYCFEATASGYEKASKCVTVIQSSQPSSNLPLTIRVTPSNPVEGDDVRVEVLDSSGNPVSGVTITINGIEYNKPSVEIPNIGSGVMNVQASAPGYSPAFKRIEVSQKPEFISSGGVKKYGGTAWWEFTAPVSYEVKLDGTVIDSGKSNNVTVELNKEGTYQIFASGEMIDEFLVKKGFFQSKFGTVTMSIVLVAVILYLIGKGGIVSSEKGNKKHSVAYAKLAHMAPLSPPAAEPYTEETEGE